MNGPRQLEIHYINTGFPYTVTESFMDLFEGLCYHEDVNLAGSSGDKENLYWSLNMNAQKHEISSPSGSFSYSHGCVNGVNNDDVGGRGTWENYSMVDYEEQFALLMDGHGSFGTASVNSLPYIEDCNRTQLAASSSEQSIWEDNIDPDNMTYERCRWSLYVLSFTILSVLLELLDLGEAVGSHSKGLPQELISSLPVSKYKCSFFSRKRTRERCVICQMHYRRGARCMTLPCKHIYHASCVSKWLSINKACPICLVEVSGAAVRP